LHTRYVTDTHEIKSVVGVSLGRFRNNQPAVIFVEEEPGFERIEVEER
jgi:hypothetical protein